MKLQARKQGSGDRRDDLCCLRADGSSTETTMPRQGTLPHDLIHAVVESALGFTDGFIGLVSKGAEIAPLARNFQEYIDPVRHAQAAQAESVVEALQSQLWRGAFDDSAFRYGVETACAMRKVPMPDLSVCDPEQDMFDRVVALNIGWQSVPCGHEWSLNFPLERRSQGSV